MGIRHAALVAAALLVAPTTARADDEAALAQQIVKKGLRAAKRSVAIGPTLGMASTFAPVHADFDGALSVGMELELYRSRLSIRGVQDLVRAKVKHRIKELVRAQIASGHRPHRHELAALARQAYEDVKAELLAELDTPLPAVRPPRGDFALEASYLFGSGDWIARLGFAAGLGPFAIGPTFSVRLGDATVARLGGEIAMHVTPGRSEQTVLDLFVRGDFELHARDRNDDQVVVGMRVLRDVF
jgi:hypothetical protein